MHSLLTVQSLLHNDSCTLLPGEIWCFFGIQGSGIDDFLSRLEQSFGTHSSSPLQPPQEVALITFSKQQQIFEHEIQHDDTDFIGTPDPGTPAYQFLPKKALSSPLIDDFKMRQALHCGYRQLSSGQSRKLLLLQAALSGSSLIIIDSPYDGLDPESCRELDKALNHLHSSKIDLILLVRNSCDIPSWCSHLGLFHKNVLTYHGATQKVADHIGEVTSSSQLQLSSGTLLDDTGLLPDHSSTVPHIQLINGFGSYGEKLLFRNLDLTVYPGQHTLITGPNGCGKSTLLHILTGDNQQCYANNLYFFGKKRGSGESIWDLKKHLGIVTPELHRSYRVPGSALMVVLSGIFDSIGLYQSVTNFQIQTAEKLLKAIRLDNVARKPFRNLSYGEQRLILIARGLIKNPPLLILDEPTHGLDQVSRNGILNFLEILAHKNNHTTIIYVSHRQDEYRSFYTTHIQLDQYQ